MKNILNQDPTRLGELGRSDRDIGSGSQAGQGRVGCTDTGDRAYRGTRITKYNHADAQVTAQEHRTPAHFLNRLDTTSHTLPYVSPRYCSPPPPVVDHLAGIPCGTLSLWADAFHSKPSAK